MKDQRDFIFTLLSATRNDIDSHRMGLRTVILNVAILRVISLLKQDNIWRKLYLSSTEPFEEIRLIPCVVLVLVI